VRPDSGTTTTKKKKERELRQISHFLIDKTLGEGTFGKVKLGIHTITQEKVAIKILEKNKIQD
jgi:5'-AMP-activated protein kinase catalytic alpha subunit